MTDERLVRWRLLLGQSAGSSLGNPDLGEDERGMDRALEVLYNPRGRGSTDGDGPGQERSAGLGSSAPYVARWLGDIRTYFPTSVVEVMQRDALERFNLTRLLLEPELMESLTPDVHTVATLVSLSDLMSEEARGTARLVVQKLVDKVEAQLANRLRSAVSGALRRGTHARARRLRDVSWDRTIRANLHNYVPERRTVVPERLVGHGRAQQVVQREVVLAIDQSGSMAESVVYSGILGSVLASMRTVHTSLVLFDTAVVDLTDQLQDPVDVLFAAQLGGGTDINRAVAYCQGLIRSPREAVFILISDLYEGGIREDFLARMRQMQESGVTCVVLLALSDEGAPSYDRGLAGDLAALGLPAFACTPERFPDLLAVAVSRGDVATWAHREIAASLVPRS